MAPDLIAQSMLIGESVLRLSVARGGGVLDDISSDVYVRGLLQCDPELVRRACDALSREPREDFQQAMPPLATILERVRSIQVTDIEARSRRALPPAPNDRLYKCWRCEDDPGGMMRPMRCPEIHCGRKHEHLPHMFTSRCPCWLEKYRERIQWLKQQHDQDPKHNKMPRDYQALMDLTDGRYRFAKPKELW